MSFQLDSVLPRLYHEFDVPADQLVTDADLGDRFLNLVRQQIGTAVDRSTVLKRLITLRKKGQLPRLRR